MAFIWMSAVLFGLRFGATQRRGVYMVALATPRSEIAIMQRRREINQHQLELKAQRHDELKKRQEAVEGSQVIPSVLIMILLHLQPR